MLRAWLITCVNASYIALLLCCSARALKRRTPEARQDAELRRAKRRAARAAQPLEQREQGNAARREARAAQPLEQREQANAARREAHYNAMNRNRAALAR